MNEQIAPQAKSALEELLEYAGEVHKDFLTTMYPIFGLDKCPPRLKIVKSDSFSCYDLIEGNFCLKPDFNVNNRIIKLSVEEEDLLKWNELQHEDEFYLKPQFRIMKDIAHESGHYLHETKDPNHFVNGLSTVLNYNRTTYGELLAEFSMMLYLKIKGNLECEEKYSKYHKDLTKREKIALWAILKEKNIISQIISGDENYSSRFTEYIKNQYELETKD